MIEEGVEKKTTTEDLRNQLQKGMGSEMCEDWGVLVERVAVVLLGRRVGGGR